MHRKKTRKKYKTGPLIFKREGIHEWFLSILCWGPRSHKYSFTSAIVRTGRESHQKGKSRLETHNITYIGLNLLSCCKGFTPLNSGFTIKHEQQMKNHLFKVSCLLIPVLVGTRTCPGQTTLLPEIICWLTRYERRIRFYLIPITQFPHPRSHSLAAS